MRDLIRFVWRGALGGAILPSLVWVYFLVATFPTPLFWLLLITGVGLAIPGAIVGGILWVLCKLFVKRLGILLRIAIGVGINSTILVMELITSDDVFFYDSVNFRRLIFTSIFYLSIGGIAGWTCPAATVFRKKPKEPELTYWERVREYEEAQAEHEFWKAKLDSRKSQNVKRST